MVRARHFWRLGASLLVLLFCAWSVSAQDVVPMGPAVLVADDIQITTDRRLIATGNVEAFQGQTRMTAQAIAYNPDTGRLTITGPISIGDGTGLRLLADQADLSDDMQNGLLLGARLVLNEQLQLAAVQANRVNGRYTELYKTVATSCKVCADDPGPPLWQIRAKRVIHDKEAQQIYFDQAQLQVLSIPVFYVPRLRLPDPSVTRTTGFLRPELVLSSLLGTGIKVPYFIALNDSRDLTLSPYLSESTRTLQFRYRELFRRGQIIVEGAVSDDDLLPDETRGYVFAAGRFDLKRDFRLQFDLEWASDDGYLSNYGISGRDRLDSQIQISRARRNEFIRFSYISMESLRDNDTEEVLPSDVLDAVYKRRFFPSVIGGEIRLSTEAHAHERSSAQDLSDAVDARDVLRFNVDAEWLRTFQMGGLQAQTRLGLIAGAYDVSDDITATETESEMSPTAALVLRYPMVKQGKDGARHVLEPIAQLAWIGGDTLSIPNEESTRVEFDEGNLLRLSRFPAPDRRERGWSAAVGATWSRIDQDGWSMSITGAQILREEAQADFTTSSGLSGTSSDFLLSGQVQLQGGLAVSGRTLFDSSLNVTKAELRGFWSYARLGLGGSYIWIDEDPAIDQLDPIGEISWGGSYQINRFWRLSGGMRYDIEEGRTATSSAILEYANECVRLGFNLSRSFASSTTIEPTTSLQVTVTLSGFSANTGERVEVRSCG